DSRLTTSYLSALIRRGGGIRPTETRQPPRRKPAARERCQFRSDPVGGDKGRLGTLCPLPLSPMGRGFLFGRARRFGARRIGTLSGIHKRSGLSRVWR